MNEVSSADRYNLSPAKYLAAKTETNRFLMVVSRSTFPSDTPGESRQGDVDDIDREDSDTGTGRKMLFAVYLCVCVCGYDILYMFVGWAIGELRVNLLDVYSGFMGDNKAYYHRPPGFTTSYKIP